MGLCAWEERPCSDSIKSHLVLLSAKSFHVPLLQCAIKAGISISAPQPVCVKRITSRPQQRQRQPRRDVKRRILPTVAFRIDERLPFLDQKECRDGYGRGNAQR